MTYVSIFWKYILLGSFSIACMYICLGLILGLDNFRLLVPGEVQLFLIQQPVALPSTTSSGKALGDFPQHTGTPVSALICTGLVNCIVEISCIHLSYIENTISQQTSCFSGSHSLFALPSMMFPKPNIRVHIVDV